MTVVGFTGAQSGMSEEQRDELMYQLEQIRFKSIAEGEREPDEFHHGDCVGADEEAVAIARARGFHLHCHPGFPEEHPKRAGTENHETYPMKDPLVRNRDIVDAADVLIACPALPNEVIRSGSWATIRYARGEGKPVILIKPSGAVVSE